MKKNKRISFQLPDYRFAEEEDYALSEKELKLYSVILPAKKKPNLFWFVLGCFITSMDSKNKKQVSKSTPAVIRTFTNPRKKHLSQEENSLQ